MKGGRGSGVCLVFCSVACGIWWIGGGDEEGLVLLCTCVLVCFNALDALCFALLLLLLSLFGCVCLDVLG